jgi:RND family efflux transporter MFP subunit
VIAVAMSLTIVAAWAVTRATGVVLKTKPRLARTVGNPIPVVATAVVRDTVKDVVGATTLSYAYQSVAVNVAVSEAQVRTVRAELGQLVQQGALLVEFDNSVFREARVRAGQQRTMARSEIQQIEVGSLSRRRELAETIVAAKERVAYWTSTLDVATKMHRRLVTLWEQQVIPLVDVEQARAKWDEAKSALAVARLELVKAENELTNEPTAAQAKLDAARFKLGIAEQELAQAEKNIDNTIVRAPHHGVIAKRSVDVGEWVKSGKTLFVVDLIAPMYAVAEIEQEKLPYVSMAEPAEVTFDTYATKVFRGKVVKVDPSVDPVKRTFRAFILLENSDSALRPGMAGFTRMSRSRQVTVVPRVAVINPTGSSSVDATVFVVYDEGVTLRKVQLGRSVGVGRLEVLGGLEPGELVVVHGQKDLNGGDRVTATIVDPTLEPGGVNAAPKLSLPGRSEPRLPATSSTTETFSAPTIRPTASLPEREQSNPVELIRKALAPAAPAPSIRPAAPVPAPERSPRREVVQTPAPPAPPAPSIRPASPPPARERSARREVVRIPAVPALPAPGIRPAAPLPEPEWSPRREAAQTAATRPVPPSTAAAVDDDMTAVIDWVLKARGAGGRNLLE